MYYENQSCICETQVAPYCPRRFFASNLLLLCEELNAFELKKSSVVLQTAKHLTGLSPYGVHRQRKKLSMERTARFVVRAHESVRETLIN